MIHDNMGLEKEHLHSKSNGFSIKQNKKKRIQHWKRS